MAHKMEYDLEELLKSSGNRKLIFEFRRLQRYIWELEFLLSKINFRIRRLVKMRNLGGIISSVGLPTFYLENKELTDYELDLLSKCFMFVSRLSFDQIYSIIRSSTIFSSNSEHNKLPLEWSDFIEKFYKGSLFQLNHRIKNTLSIYRREFLHIWFLRNQLKNKGEMYSNLLIEDKIQKVKMRCYIHPKIRRTKLFNLLAQEENIKVDELKTYDFKLPEIFNKNIFLIKNFYNQLSLSIKDMSE